MDAALQNRSISKHVYAAIAQTTPMVNGNSAIIVTKRRLVIVDSQSSPSAAQSLCNQFKREVADLPVRYVINTHHHLDHAHGNAAYLEMFGPQADIISTSLTQAALKQAGRWFLGFIRRQPAPLPQLQEVPNQERYYAFVESYIGGLREDQPALEGRILRLTGEERAAAQSRLESLRSYFSEMSAFAPAVVRQIVVPYIREGFLPAWGKLFGLGLQAIRRPAKDARRKREPCLGLVTWKGVWSSENGSKSLCCDYVAMVQPAESRQGLNLAVTRRADFRRPTCWRVLRESKMSPVLVIVE
jgi:Metallo-beta-lactamase superfamily